MLSLSLSLFLSFSSDTRVISRRAPTRATDAVGELFIPRKRNKRFAQLRNAYRATEFSLGFLPGPAACSNRRSFNRISLVSVPVGIPPSRPHCVAGSSVPYSANRREFRVAELELGLRLDYQDGGSPPPPFDPPCRSLWSLRCLPQVGSGCL